MPAACEVNASIMAKVEGWEIGLGEGPNFNQ